MFEDTMFDENTVFKTGLTLHIDADTVVYATACIFNEDDDDSRENMARHMANKISKLQTAADADDVVCFLTTRTNFRDDLVDDYKANRADTERPINLAWGKQWLTQNYDCRWQDLLEADDLLGIYAREDAIIWSVDKDLRQIPGLHLDDATQRVKEITYEGSLVKTGKKIYFDGMLGFYFQCLTGDSTDHILGCAYREECTYKSGAKIGQQYTKRVGIGPVEAYNLLVDAEDPLAVVIEQYEELHDTDAMYNLELQANLLWMVREYMPVAGQIQRWTFDGREEWYSLEGNQIL